MNGAWWPADSPSPRLGAGATILYITGASCLYVGRFSTGGGALVGALLGGVAFRRFLGPYLDALDARVNDNPHQVSHEREFNGDE